MNVLVLLAIILFLLMVLIGGKKGAKSFISLFLNFGVLLYIMFEMTLPQANPNLLALVAGTIVSCITLFFVNEVNSKTITAFISTVITISILLFIIYILTEKALIQGFGEEEIDELIVYILCIWEWTLSK
jgi:Predicted multitransmembrane protein